MQEAKYVERRRKLRNERFLTNENYYTGDQEEYQPARKGKVNYPRMSQVSYQ